MHYLLLVRMGKVPPPPVHIRCHHPVVELTLLQVVSLDSAVALSGGPLASVGGLLVALVEHR